MRAVHVHAHTVAVQVGRRRVREDGRELLLLPLLQPHAENREEVDMALHFRSEACVRAHALPIHPLRGPACLRAPGGQSSLPCGADLTTHACMALPKDPDLLGLMRSLRALEP